MRAALSLIEAGVGTDWPRIPLAQNSAVYPS